jgi:hypothetical protein
VEKNVDMVSQCRLGAVGQPDADDLKTGASGAIGHKEGQTSLSGDQSDNFC